MGGTKVCLQHLGHMTKIAPTSKLFKNLLWNKGPMDWGLVCITGDICTINDSLVLTLTFFMESSFFFFFNIGKTFFF